MSEQQQEQASNVQPKAEGGIISLVVQDQNGTEVMFKVKPHTKLVKVMDAYIQKKNLDPSRIRFLFDGQRIMNDDTPEKMGIEDGDHIVSDKAGCLIAEYEKWQERAGRY